MFKIGLCFVILACGINARPKLHNNVQLKTDSDIENLPDSKLNYPNVLEHHFKVISTRSDQRFSVSFGRRQQGDYEFSKNHMNTSEFGGGEDDPFYSIDLTVFSPYDNNTIHTYIECEVHVKSSSEEAEVVLRVAGIGEESASVQLHGSFVEYMSFNTTIFKTYGRISSD